MKLLIVVHHRFELWNALLWLAERLQQWDCSTNKLLTYSAVFFASGRVVHLGNLLDCSSDTDNTKESPMPIPELKRIRKQLQQGWERVRVRAQKASKEVWVAAAMGLLVVLLVGLHTAFSQKTATLRLRVQHSFHGAQLTVSVDDDPAYSAKLTGAMHKKFGLLPEGIQGTWSQTIPVTAGRHRISVRVVGDDGSDHVDNTSAKFVGGSERELLVVARHSDLSATWPGSGNSVSAALPSTFPASEPSWFTRYASALFLTIAGSIVSALAGYAIREIPVRLRNRALEGKTSASRAAAAGR